MLSCRQRKHVPWCYRVDSTMMLLCRQCKHVPWCLWRHCTVTVDALSFLSSFFLSSFLSLIPLSDQNLHSFLLRGNKCNGLETLTQCAEWSQFTFQHFLKFDLQSKNYSPSKCRVYERHWSISLQLLWWHVCLSQTGGDIYCSEACCSLLGKQTLYNVDTVSSHNKLFVAWNIYAHTKRHTRVMWGGFQWNMSWCENN